MKDKKFDAVKFMRDIRDELSRNYNKEPEQQNKDLALIRKKYAKLNRITASKRSNKSLPIQN